MVVQRGQAYPQPRRHLGQGQLLQPVDVGQFGGNIHYLPPINPNATRHGVEISPVHGQLLQ